MAAIEPLDLDPTASLVSPGKAPKRSSRGRLIWLRLKATPRFWIGVVVVALMILWAIIGLWFTHWNPTDQDLINSSTGPSATHWFGTDDIGQDIYAETVSGLRKSLVIGLIAGPAGTLIAAFVGSFAGYLGGKADAAIAAITITKAVSIIRAWIWAAVERQERPGKAGRARRSALVDRGRQWLFAETS